jgi:Secretion system C-terminal sorting domain
MQQLKIKDTFKIEGLALLGAGATHLSTAIFPAEPKIPNIQFIEAEMSLVGEIQDSIDLPASTINIAHPGSKSSLALQNSGQYAYDWYRYPAYNEALGIVAVLEQPKAQYAYSSEQYESHSDAYLKVKMAAPLKFYYNPALNVDIENTKVYAAYATRVDKKWALGTDQIGDFNRVHDKATNSSYDYFITNFVPLDCFQSMKAEMAQSILSGPNDFLAKSEIDIKVMFLIKYKKDKYGKEKQHLLQLTFPLDLALENASEFTQLENFGQYPYSQLIENRHFITNTTIHVWNDILVLGNITTVPGVVVNLIAGNEVIIAPNANISSGINIISGQKLAVCVSLPPLQVSADYVKAFCKDNNRYKANISTKRDDEPINAILNHNNIFTNSLDIVPNPFANQLTIHFALQEVSPVSISLMNAIGQVIKSQAFTQKEIGEYEEIMETNDIAPGIYYLTLQTKSGVETKKIVKQL